MVSAAVILEKYQDFDCTIPGYACGWLHIYYDTVYFKTLPMLQVTWLLVYDQCFIIFVTMGIKCDYEFQA